MSFLKNCDMFGKQPSLYFQGKRSYQTFTGAALSLLTGSMSVALIIYFFVRVLMRSNLVAVESREYKDDQEFDYTPYQQLIQLTKSDGSLFTPEEEKSLFTMNIIYFYTEKDGDTKQKYIFDSLKACEPSDLGEKASLFENIKNLERYYCVPSNIHRNLYGVYGGIKKFSSFLLYISKCRNSPHCLPDEEIEAKLFDFYVNLAFIDYNIQNDNLSVPGEAYVKQERIQVGISLYKRIFYELSIVEYSSDFGYIFPDIQVESFFTTSNFTMIPDKRLGYSMFGANFGLSRNKIKILRSFEKLQQVLSNIGGAVKALSVAGRLISMLLFDNYYFEELIKKIEVQEAGQIKPIRFIKAESQVNRSSVGLRTKEIKEKPKMSVVTNFRLVMSCGKFRGKDYFSSKITAVKRFLSIDNVLSHFVELSNLKAILFNPDERKAFEKLSLIQGKEGHSAKAIEVLTNKQRNFVEDKLLKFIK